MRFNQVPGKDFSPKGLNAFGESLQRQISSANKREWFFGITPENRFYVAIPDTDIPERYRNADILSKCAIEYDIVAAEHFDPEGYKTMSCCRALSPTSASDTIIKFLVGPLGFAKKEDNANLALPKLPVASISFGKWGEAELEEHSMHLKNTEYQLLCFSIPHQPQEKDSRILLVTHAMQHGIIVLFEGRETKFCVDLKKTPRSSAAEQLISFAQTLEVVDSRVLRVRWTPYQ